VTKAYIKRAKGHWLQGKGYKDDGAERQFSKLEIKQLLAEDEEEYLDRYHKGARTRNMEACLEYRIKWYAEAISRYKCSDSFTNSLRSGLEKAKKDLVKFNEKGKKRSNY